MELWNFFICLPKLHAENNPAHLDSVCVRSDGSRENGVEEDE